MADNARQVQRGFKAANALCLADTVCCQNQPLAMDSTSPEEGHVLRIELAPEWPCLRVIGEQLALLRALVPLAKQQQQFLPLRAGQDLEVHVSCAALAASSAIFALSSSSVRFMCLNSICCLSPYFFGRSFAAIHLRVSIRS